jgi:hypothetical protein
LALAFLFSIYILSGDVGRKKAFLYGLMLTPLTVLSYLVANGKFMEFLTLNYGGVLNFFETGNVLYGSAVVVGWLIYLIPLFIYLNINKIYLYFLIFILIIYSILSMSRSFILSIIIALILYLISFKNSIFKFISILIITIGFSYYSITSNIFSLHSQSKGGSNAVRYSKMIDTFESFLNAPILGVGYGGANILDKSINIIEPSVQNAQNYTNLQKVSASAEFTPLQIASETGILGIFFSIWLMVLVAKAVSRLLGDKKIDGYLLAITYCWLINFIYGFIGSNYFSQFIVSLTIPIAIYQIANPNKYI